MQSEVVHVHYISLLPKFHHLITWTNSQKCKQECTIIYTEKIQKNLVPSLHSKAITYYSHKHKGIYKITSKKSRTREKKINLGSDTAGKQEIYLEWPLENFRTCTDQPDLRPRPQIAGHEQQWSLVPAPSCGGKDEPLGSLESICKRSSVLCFEFCPYK